MCFSKFAILKFVFKNYTFHNILFRPSARVSYDMVGQGSNFFKWLVQLENHISFIASISYNMFTITAGLPSERKISFVLHEPDNGSEGSSNTTVTLQVVKLIAI